jgi:uncharacterized membrane protein
MKKILSIILILLMIVVMVPILLTGCAQAAEATEDTMSAAEIVSIVVNALIIPLMAWLVTKITTAVDKKTHNDELKKHFNTAINAIYTAVKEIMQIYVDALKKDGNWTEETQKEAFKRAKAKAILIMGGAVLTALPEIVGDVDVWIDSMIEAATQDVKNAKAATPPAPVAA